MTHQPTTAAFQVITEGTVFRDHGDDIKVKTEVVIAPEEIAARRYRAESAETTAARIARERLADRLEDTYPNTTIAVAQISATPVQDN